MLGDCHQVGKVCDCTLSPVLLLWESRLVVVLLLRKIVVELLMEVLLDHGELVIHQWGGYKVGLHQSLAGTWVKTAIMDQRIEVWL